MPIAGYVPGKKAKIRQGIVSVDPPSIAAGASANVDVTVPYLSVGDKVIVECADDLEAGLVPQQEVLRLHPQGVLFLLLWLGQPFYQGRLERGRTHKVGGAILESVKEVS